MRRFRPKIAVWALAGGAALVAAVILFGLPIDRITRPVSSTPVERPDEVVRAHEVLVRINRDYAARLLSMERLQGEGLTDGVFGLRARDEVLSSAERLLAGGRHPRNAAEAAARKTAQLAKGLSASAARMGILMGPEIGPQHLRARIKDPAQQKNMAAAIYDFQRAECMRQLLMRIAAGREEEEKDETPQPAG